jgi:tRNA nucleotidyltransferase (CCA-adding enzyme)
MLVTLGACKPTNKLAEFLLACEADAKGRTGLESKPYPQAERLRSAAKAVSTVDTSAIVNSELKGANIGEAIRRLRIKAIAELITAYG